MTRPRKRTNTRTRPLALGYVRVSTEDQVTNGASLDSQRNALAAEAERRGWDLEIVADEGLSAKDLNRPALQDVLARLDRGDADVLIARRVDRISRSNSDFAGLLDRAIGNQWLVVLLDSPVDMSTPTGKAMAQMQSIFAELERELIRARTREGMAQRKLDGYAPTANNPTGRPAGRPRALPDDVRAHIAAEHAAGKGWSELARQLNADGVPTARGGTTWYPSAVRAAALSVAVDTVTA